GRKKNPKPSASEQIELAKYRNLVATEIEKIERLLQPESDFDRAKNWYLEKIKAFTTHEAKSGFIKAEIEKTKKSVSFFESNSYWLGFERNAKYYEGALKYLEFLKGERNKIEDEPKQKNRADYTKTNWFKIGLKFANGEMDKLLEKHNPTQVAKNLGNENGYRPFISATLGKTKGNNIYASRDKMEKIQAYCQENNIATTPHFNAAYKRLK
ncbi:MAG TPA: hypothetical protein VNJ07_07330, partial [Chitinophagales bacterium]|nr:hypothetical protein [Chitinophagales bacterium]